MKLLVLFCYVVAARSANVGNKSKRFPDDFIFGASTSAYQIEGGWNADDKGESIWDYLTHNTPGAISDRSTGDIAADSYHSYKRDVQMMRELGLDMYRFSISWSRILPNGDTKCISQAGISYYNNLINEMLKYNIKPMVTLYHWDLPQKLQDKGGFLNPLIADWFEGFARVAFEHFGDRVKHWITFNEAYHICYNGYGSVKNAPRLNKTGVGEYECGKNLLLAHAMAYHAYNNDYKPIQKGICGYAIAVGAYLPLNDTIEDKLAVELYKQIQWTLYTDPIYSKEGGFPKELLERVAVKSAAQGYPKPRLIDFTKEEKAYIRGTSDFFGVNHYTGCFVSYSLYKVKTTPVPSCYDDIGVGNYIPDEWPQGSSVWMRHMPDSMFTVLNHVQERYGGDIPMFITENGWSTQTGREDDGRVNFYRAALQGTLDAVDKGLNVLGYFAWSLMDNFEWTSGYTVRFGLYEVNLDDPERPRTPRKSAFVYKQIIKTRVIDPKYEPGNYTMTIDEDH